MKQNFITNCFIGFLGILLACTQYKGEIELINNAEQLISHAEIKVCNQTLVFENIEPNQRVVGQFKISSDCYYEVKIQFSGGGSLSEEIGYVADGFNISNRILIEKSKISIELIKIE